MASSRALASIPTAVSRRLCVPRSCATRGRTVSARWPMLSGWQASDVKDVHLTDLISGRETLEEVQPIVFCGGFSNSDVLGRAKGWAAGILFNERAKATLDRF